MTAAQADGAPKSPEAPLEDPNSPLVITGQILCVLVPLAKSHDMHPLLLEMIGPSQRGEPPCIPHQRRPVLLEPATRAGAPDRT
jgi:hypothetical protein